MMRYSAASMALRMLVTFTYTQKGIDLMQLLTHFLHINKVCSECVLTGRSLDILCSCLILWLRVFCINTVKQIQSKVYSNKAKRLYVPWYPSNHITALTAPIRLTQQHNSTHQQHLTRALTYFCQRLGRKTGGRKEEKTAANYNMNIDYSDSDFQMVWSK